MATSDWRFPALLITAMLLAMVFTLLQQRAYTRELNRTLGRASGDHLMLVSGRGRSFRGGAIVIMIVDLAQRQIVEASVMSGLTVFARFRPEPRLTGPLEGVVDRINGTQIKAAVQMATAQIRPQAEPTVVPACTTSAPHIMRRRLVPTLNIERKN